MTDNYWYTKALADWITHVVFTGVITDDDKARLTAAAKRLNELNEFSEEVMGVYKEMLEFQAKSKKSWWDKFIKKNNA